MSTVRTVPSNIYHAATAPLQVFRAKAVESCHADTGVHLQQRFGCQVGYDRSTQALGLSALSGVMRMVAMHLTYAMIAQDLHATFDHKCTVVTCCSDAESADP